MSTKSRRITLPRELFDRLITELAWEDEVIKEYQHIQIINAMWDNDYEVIHFDFDTKGKLDS